MILPLRCRPIHYGQQQGLRVVSQFKYLGWTISESRIGLISRAEQTIEAVELFGKSKVRLLGAWFSQSFCRPANFEQKQWNFSELKKIR